MAVLVDLGGPGGVKNGQKNDVEKRYRKSGKRVSPGDPKIALKSIDLCKKIKLVALWDRSRSGPRKRDFLEALGGGPR